jgi:ssDNA-binding Zn-finger/Zn-ribbon topoisomerase 1
MVDKDADRRDGHDGPERRRYWRGGRRESDWPASVVMPIRCPRCDSAEVKFVEATPETVFWQCHRCRADWTTAPDGTPARV